MRVYGFKAPQERLGPQFFRSEQSFENANTGRFVRNAVLDGMTYGGNDLVPAFLKTCDAVHPLCGTEDYDGVAQSCYGALLDSVNNATTKAAIKAGVQPWNTGVGWAPGGTGVDAWLAVRLPENTLIERYVLVSTATTCPLSFKIQGSLDGSTWADLHVVENSGVWESSYTEKVFTIPEEGRGSYLWYRFYVTASNAATMSIRNFRLWRAQSVCDRGQLRVDASAGSPLLLSFMNGFASDGVTPVDYGERLSAAIVQALGDYDSEGLPISRQGTVPVDIFAKRDSGGSVVVSVEAASDTETEYLAGRMRGPVDRGFMSSGPYDCWGTSVNANCGGVNTLTRVDGKPFYCTKIIINATGSPAQLIIIEEDKSISGKFERGTHLVRRFIRGVRTVIVYGGSRDLMAARFFAQPSPLKYRISAGKVYQKDTRAEASAWPPVQKIKIGSAVYNGTDLYQLQPRSSMLMQWMTQGDNVSYLDA